MRDAFHFLKISVGENTPSGDFFIRGIFFAPNPKTF